MALHRCAECQKEVSDKALACPHCGTPQGGSPSLARGRGKRMALIAAGAVAGRSSAASRRRWCSFAPTTRGSKSSADSKTQRGRTKSTRANASSARTKRTRATRCTSTSGHAASTTRPSNRGWPRRGCARTRSSPGTTTWRRGRSRQNRVPEAYAIAQKGAEIDPGNLELAGKRIALKTMLDHKLPGEVRPAPNGYIRFTDKENVAKSAVHYQGLFRSFVRSPDRADFQAIEASRLGRREDPRRRRGARALRVRKPVCRFVRARVRPARRSVHRGVAAPGHRRHDVEGAPARHRLGSGRDHREG